MWGIGDIILSYRSSPMTDYQWDSSPITGMPLYLLGKGRHKHRLVDSCYLDSEFPGLRRKTHRHAVLVDALLSLLLVWGGLVAKLMFDLVFPDITRWEVQLYWIMREGVPWGRIYKPWFPAPHLAHDSCRRRRVRIGEALLLRRTKRLEPNQSCRLVIAVYWSKL